MDPFGIRLQEVTRFRDSYSFTKKLGTRYTHLRDINFSKLLLSIKTLDCALIQKRYYYFFVTDRYLHVLYSATECVGGGISE